MCCVRADVVAVKNDAAMSAAFSYFIEDLRHEFVYQSAFIVFDPQQQRQQQARFYGRKQSFFKCFVTELLLLVLVNFGTPEQLTAGSYEYIQVSSPVYTVYVVQATQLNFGRFFCTNSHEPFFELRFNCVESNHCKVSSLLDSHVKSFVVDFYQCPSMPLSLSICHMSTRSNHFSHSR